MSSLDILMEGTLVLENVKNRLAKSKWLAWAVKNPDLWLWRRHNVALGAAIGVGLGLLIPLAQIPASAALSVLFRANVGVAALSTLITNPVTFAPIYYLAFRFGEMVSGVPFAPMNETQSYFEWFAGVGLPLVIGLSCFAVIGSVLTYVGVYSAFGLFKRQSD